MLYVVNKLVEIWNWTASVSNCQKNRKGQLESVFLGDVRSLEED